ncbi:LRAT domain-containing protein [Cephalotus follicularis]|uniref:LRAT domain-containing protein n=1 Tax=Cephalotus follicularis TaxID=3775 RepID=A0A1Q3DDT7_CEPFO|nr:LRAT domain-containing protein [Cephalotus follicularis]
MEKEMERNQIKLPQFDPSCLIEEKDLKLGDHIYAWRAWRLFSHHGIYVGNGIVINFNTPDTESTKSIANIPKEDASPESERCPRCDYMTPGSPGVTIVKTCLKHFGSTFYLYKYGVSWFEFYTTPRGTCCPFDAKPLQETVDTAWEKLKTGFGEYNTLTNNCEHFATYCKTGIKFCAQVLPSIILVEKAQVLPIDQIPVEKLLRITAGK